ncbi:MAG: hypothetical protein AAF682_16885 [Planctomycetota bacterium]
MTLPASASGSQHAGGEALALENGFSKGALVLTAGEVFWDLGGGRVATENGGTVRLDAPIASAARRHPDCLKDAYHVSLRVGLGSKAVAVRGSGRDGYVEIESKVGGEHALCVHVEQPTTFEPSVQHVEGVVVGAAREVLSRSAGRTRAAARFRSFGLDGDKAWPSRINRLALSERVHSLADSRYEDQPQMELSYAERARYVESFRTDDALWTIVIPRGRMRQADPLFDELMFAYAWSILPLGTYSAVRGLDQASASFSRARMYPEAIMVYDVGAASDAELKDLETEVEADNPISTQLAFPGDRSVALFCASELLTVEHLRSIAGTPGALDPPSELDKTSTLTLHVPALVRRFGAYGARSILEQAYRYTGQPTSRAHLLELVDAAPAVVIDLESGSISPRPSLREAEAK